MEPVEEMAIEKAKERVVERLMKAQGSSSNAEVRRLHIVYFLSRSGAGVEHPHLIRVHRLSSNGIRLLDVKKWLAELRGKDMPESFAWSYKRHNCPQGTFQLIKGWQFTNIGSAEVSCSNLLRLCQFSGCTQTPTRLGHNLRFSSSTNPQAGTVRASKVGVQPFWDIKAQFVNIGQVSYQLSMIFNYKVNDCWLRQMKYRTGYKWQDLLDDDLIIPISDNEYVLKGSEISSPTFNKDLSYTQKEVPMQEGPLSLEEIEGHKPSCIQIHSEKSMDVTTKTPSEIEEESPIFGSETSTFTTDSGELDLESEPEKNSHTVKQENMHGSTDQEPKLPSKDLRNENPMPSLNSTPSSKDKKKMNNKVPMEKNTTPASSEPSFTKNKSYSNGIFKNLISCGAVDTNDSAVVTIDRKNKTFLNMCSTDQNNVHSAEICKRDKLGGSQRIFGQQRNGRRSCDGEKDSRKQRPPSTAYKQIRGPNCSQCGKSFKPEKLLSHMKYCKGMKAIAKSANPAFSASIVQTKSQRPSSKEPQNKDLLSGYYITS